MGLFDAAYTGIRAYLNAENKQLYYVAWFNGRRVMYASTREQAQAVLNLYKRGEIK